MNLAPSNYRTFKKDLRKYTWGYKKENKILVDLEYQAFFHKEQKRKQAQIEESAFMDKLRPYVFPCCNLGFSEAMDTSYLPDLSVIKRVEVREENFK
jgi:hypothetical protein